jgi:hypothetical protein
VVAQELQVEASVELFPLVGLMVVVVAAVAADTGDMADKVRSMGDILVGRVDTLVDKDLQRVADT